MCGMRREKFRISAVDGRKEGRNKGGGSKDGKILKLYWEKFEDS